MTTSRYCSNITFLNGIQLSENDWKEFIKSIKTGCVFTTICRDMSERRTYGLCKFSARYYHDNSNKIYYHITNDERRKLVNYIKKNWDK